MRNPLQNKYFSAGLTTLCVIMLSIAFFFCLFKFNTLVAMFSKIVSVLMPFVFGLCLAYLLLPMFNFAYAHIDPLLQKHMKKTKNAKRLTKILSTSFAMIVGILLVTALLSMVLPQITTSIITLIDSNIMQTSFQNLTKWLQDVLASNPDIRETAMRFYDEIISTVTVWVKTDMLPQLNSIMSGLMGTMNFAKNLFVGIFITIYVLNSKELFSAQAKKMVYSMFTVPHANLIIDNIRFTHHVFGGFINGKLLDSLIIGVICFCGMNLFHLPYAMLVSVIIGVTNIIPFFGPFIGAIPCTLFILLISPIQAVYFLLFVLALQQFDGNILGPKILGNSTGLSSFWVMFAILVFGGLFGFLGMIVGVPIFAVLYSFIAGLVNRSLRERHLPQQTAHYYNLDHIGTTDGRMAYGRTAPTAMQSETREKP